MKKKVFYWSPHINEQIATVKAVVNSALSLIKYSKNYDPTIINVFGEWNSLKNLLNDKNLNFKNLMNLNIKLPINGFLKSRIFYTFLSLVILIPLYKFLRKEKPDYLIIHLITVPVLILCFFFNFKTKFILRISGYPKLNFLRKIFWKLVSKKIYKIFTPTQITKKMLIDNGIFNENKIFLLRDPIISIRNLNTLKRQKISNDFNHNNYILSIGRLTKQKNFQFLVKAYTLLKKEVMHLPKLIIIGEGEEKNNLNHKIRENNMEKDIFILGYKSNVFQYLHKSLFFLLSSSWEDPGFVLVEAAASNKLILSSNVLSGPKEFLYNKSSGFLFEKENIRDFKNKVKYILSNINSKEIFINKVNAKKNSKNYTLFFHFKELIKLL
tara:strand:+ start:11474 stop:12619 length:1146 start_codon:yes stop_codon:yes gene_type:complete